MEKEIKKLSLKSIFVSNFVTIEKEYIEFDNNFNAIIGETGSGKSLLLNAIHIILGMRGDKKYLRKGTNQSILEATFETNDPEVQTYLESLGYPLTDNQIIIKRIISSEGATKNYLNLQQCNLNTLKDFAKRYIDLVGQFENQKLLSSKYQLKLLDNYSKNYKYLDEYQNKYSELKTNIELLSGKTASLNDLKQQEDYLLYQIKQIEKLSPSEKREKELLELKEKISNEIADVNTYEQIEGLINNPDTGLLNSFNQLLKMLNQSSIVSETDLSSITDTHALLQELSYKISSNDEQKNLQEKLEEVLDELHDYQSLKRKFGGDIHSLIDQHEDFKEKIGSINILEATIRKLTHQQQALKEDLRLIASKLHTLRLTAAKSLSKKLNQNIKKLNMLGATINIQINELPELNEYGHSKVEILAETNPGQGMHPIKEIASGGELSRILLALRNILSSSDTISVFFFDEVDTGTGGITASYIGKVLSEISNDSQVIAITHLPQIAQFASSIIHITKEIEKKKTITSTQVLRGSAKEKALLQMTGSLN